MAKVSGTIGRKSKIGPSSVLAFKDVHEDGVDFHVEDGSIEPNFGLGDSEDLCLDKVEGLLGIHTQTSGKAQSEIGLPVAAAPTEISTRSGRRVIAKRRPGEEKEFTSSLAIITNRGRGSSAKISKVTLKAGGPPPTLNSDTGSAAGSHSEKSHATTMKSKQNTRTRSETAQQISNTGSGPRTPGTPSSDTPNPPTPGNNSMVNSPHQYVTITVDGEGGVVTEGGVNVGGANSSYVTYLEDSTDHSSIYAAAAANGHTMAYPVYNVGETGAIYASGSTPYYPNNTAPSSYGQGENEERDEIGEAGRGLTTAEINSILSGGDSSTMSTMSSSPEAETIHHHHHRQALLDGGVYMVPSGGNSNGTGSENDGSHHLSHATRVSPTTKRKRSLSSNLHQIERPELNQLDGGMSGSDESSEEDEEEGSESGAVPSTTGSQVGEFVGDGVEGDAGMLGFDSFLSDADMKTLSKLYPITKSSSSALFSPNSLKTCPNTVQWLLDNYETAEGVSLPRSTLYNHYLRHCSENKLDPVNAASFGKLIRSVFLGLRTRRLGTRGNSKYHYYGIRLKPSSPLNNLPEDFHYPTSIHGYGGGRPGGGAKNGENGATKRLKTVKSENIDGGHSNGFAISDAITVQQYLGDASGALDDFPELDLDAELPDGLEDNDLHVFGTIYKEHCENLLETLSRFQLAQVESIWKCFWRTNTGEVANNETVLEYEKIFPKMKLMMICQVKAVQEFVKEVDFMLYQKIVGLLLPDVLRPIPSTMTQAIRNFAKTLENWLTAAMVGYSDDVVVLKVAIVSALAQTLRRYTSLNHLAQAARAVLQNQGQINQMLSDLNRVDFHNVEEQASWVCGCNGDVVPNLEQDFKATLAQQQSLEQWATWLEGVVDRVLRAHVNTPGYVQAARHFLLKWSFYSSLVIRDLTLRSAASFGSFHLLRLLYDEYMFYLVEHRVAQVTGVVPIAVIGKKFGDKSFGFPQIGTPESQSINGHNNGSSISSGVDSTTTNPGDPQAIISHTNNNTSFGNNTVKSELRRSKHFLTS